jgi:hypothetical protein
MLTLTVGRSFADTVLPGTAAFTSLKFASAGSDEKLGGNLLTALHDPARSVVEYQLLSLSR